MSQSRHTYLTNHKAKNANSYTIEIVLEQVGPLKPVPELMAVKIVAGWKIDYSAHGYLSLQAIGLS